MAGVPVNNTNPVIPARLGVAQRVLPTYRAPFFEALAAACRDGLGVFAGAPRPEEAIDAAGDLKRAQLFRGRNRHLLRRNFYLLLQPDLTRWLSTWLPDVLILEANPRYLSTPSAVRWMNARRRPVIGWGLGAPHTAGWLGNLRRNFIRQFDALLTYSSRGAEEYAALGFPAERIFVAPNAAAPRPLDPPPMRPVETKGPLTVLFTGRLQARKRVDLLLQACASLPLNLQPNLLIIGDGPERPALQALARQVYPRAEFPGALFGEALLPHLGAADLFVLPGTGGLAVQQAMSAALPVIVAEADGTAADLVRPQNGWQVIPGSLESLTSTLASALADVPRLRRMGLASYHIVRDEINLEAMVAAFARAAACVMGGNNAHPAGG